ncbi:hypothetical protein OCU04_009110 [Sclerotinia nivalis]|uniref:Uncharacterized protein n=1 Tax=Sclerotinia nivalis TaxID=352851 RepID=A0A9X0AGU8_9HELO|nr:hypothetical protein OCU04_009110 [Sclerotinia nivalis]
MRFAKTILLAMHCITAVQSLAIDYFATIEGQPMPDRWIRYDLTYVNTTTTGISLTPRTNIQACQRTLNVVNDPRSSHYRIQAAAAGLMAHWMEFHGFITRLEGTVTQPPKPLLSRELSNNTCNRPMAIAYAPRNVSTSPTQAPGPAISLLDQQKVSIVPRIVDLHFPSRHAHPEERITYEPTAALNLALDGT